MKKTYYIFRHGLTLPVKKKQWYWHTLYSAHLIDEGKPSVERLAAYMKDIKADYYVSSPFLRCRQTAEIVTRVTGDKFATDKRLGEYVFEFPWNFKKRILSFISDMETSGYKSIVICTHSIVIEMLIQYITNEKLRFFHRLTAPLTGVLTIVKDGKISEKNFNNE
jgi:broad specificity phosphatase PhoE